MLLLLLLRRQDIAQTLHAEVEEEPEKWGWPNDSNITGVPRV